MKYLECNVLLYNVTYYCSLVYFTHYICLFGYTGLVNNNCVVLLNTNIV